MPDVLGLALEHFRAATDGKPIPECGRWKDWADDMRKVIGGFLNPIDVLRYAQDCSKIPFTHRAKANPGLIKACVDIIEDEFHEYKMQFARMEDDPGSAPESLVRWEGKRLLSNMFLWHAWAMLTCQSHLKNIHSIVEIGGGNGALARLWCLYHPVRRYTIIDLPESLYFAEVCLRSVFGDEVGYFVDRHPDTRIVLVPVDRLEQYEDKYDLVISVGSIQEMIDEWSEYYMRWLDTSGALYFYSLNYVAHPINRMKEGRCFWGPRPSTHWATKVLSLDPAVIRIMCPQRHFLEALYYRGETHGRLNQWSVFRGHALTPATYVEGLDLLRQSMTKVNVDLFLETVFSGYQSLGMIPKELGVLAGTSDCSAGRLIREYCANTPNSLVA